MNKAHWKLLLGVPTVALALLLGSAGGDQPEPIPAELTFTYSTVSRTKVEPNVPVTTVRLDYTVTMPGFLEVVQQDGDGDFLQTRLTPEIPGKKKTGPRT